MVLSWHLGLKISEVFSNLNNSMIQNLSGFLLHGEGTSLAPSPASSAPHFCPQPHGQHWPWLNSWFMIMVPRALQHLCGNWHSHEGVHRGSPVLQTDLGHRTSCDKYRQRILNITLRLTMPSDLSTLAFYWQVKDRRYSVKQHCTCSEMLQLKFFKGLLFSML